MSVLKIKNSQGQWKEVETIKGTDGVSPDLQIGTVETLPAGSSATASITGTQANPLLNLGLPYPALDDTLTQEGKAADAKATGEAIDAVDAKAETIRTATASDVGKALMAKTVTDGKVTEWEFGETGEETATLVDKLMGDFYDYTPVSVTATRSGYAIDPVTGCYVANSAYVTKGYNVTAGDIIKVVSDYLFQFQDGQNTPATTQPSARIGTTYEAGLYYIEVPEGANALKISTSASDGIGACYVISAGVNTEVDDINSFISDKAVNSRLDMVATISSDNSQQVADTSNSSTSLISASINLYETSNILLDMSETGFYYNNPIGKCTFRAIRFYDANDNVLTLTKEDTGTSADYLLETNLFARIEKIDGTHIAVTNWVSEQLYKTTLGATTYYELSGTIDHVITSMRHKGIIPVGVTYELPTAVYIPMGMNLQYNEELSDAVWNDFLNNKRYYDAPNGMSNAKLFRAYSLSDNIFDDDLIDFANHTEGGGYSLKPGRRVPVIGGKTFISNTLLNAVMAYNASGVGTSIGNTGVGVPKTLPDDAVEISFVIIQSSWGSDPYRVVSIWYLDENKLYPTSDVVRPALPMAQISGWEINKNLYDYCKPDEDSEVVRMIKTFAIREMNHQKDAFRVGTFNVYVNRQATNKEVIRKMMGTYGIDLCGFQESQNYQSGTRYNLGDYLKGWQFGYCSTAEEDLASARHIVSALEIASSEAFAIGAGTNTCLKCVINMPRYKDYKDGLTTLSFYTYHGIVSSDAERILEVNDILAKVAVDTSDFIVVCGDTNDFSGQPNYTHDRWAQFEAAGLTPVHDGSSETVTDRSCSIDNIFISSHIKCLYYDVINSGDWMYKPTPTSSPVPVSDHDFVYADLQFDFDAAIAARNN